jgi:hypothetical protein
VLPLVLLEPVVPVEPELPLVPIEPLEPDDPVLPEEPLEPLLERVGGSLELPVAVRPASTPWLS